MQNLKANIEPPKTKKIENQDFIERLIERDEIAFKELVNGYKDRVYNTCLGFLRNKHDAEDVTQEVFIQVFDSIVEYREESSLATWIYKIAVNKSLELIRYRKRKKRSEFFKALNFMSTTEAGEEADETGDMHPGVQLENKERAAVLFGEIEQLSEKQRIAFTLHKVEGLSYKEVAEIMDLKLPAVESLIYRAKENLKKRLFSYYKQNELN